MNNNRLAALLRPVSDNRMGRVAILSICIMLFDLFMMTLVPRPVPLISAAVSILMACMSALHILSARFSKATWLNLSLWYHLARKGREGEYRSRCLFLAKIFFLLAILFCALSATVTVGYLCVLLIATLLPM